jgi:hypothetical protein
MIACDKQAHFWAGAGIAATVALYVDPLVGLAVGVIRDRQHRKVNDWQHYFSGVVLWPLVLRGTQMKNRFPYVCFGTATSPDINQP